jgi:hypothetical protein
VQEKNKTDAEMRKELKELSETFTEYNKKQKKDMKALLKDLEVEKSRKEELQKKIVDEMRHMGIPTTRINLTQVNKPEVYDDQINSRNETK